MIYQEYRVTLSFESPIAFHVNPIFLIRSMLGVALHSMCCIARTQSCPSCLYNKTCVYSWLFESILSKDNEIVPARDRSSHPYILFDIRNDPDERSEAEKTLSSYSFALVLIGKAVDYIPYIYAALVNAGKRGVQKERTKFVIAEMTAGGRTILENDGSLKTDVPIQIFKCTRHTDMCVSEGDGEENGGALRGSVLVQLKTPLRFKSKGRYTKDFSARDFFSCLSRRADTVMRLYGEREDAVEYASDGSGDSPIDERIAVVERDLKWVNQKHFSARQRREMLLGGAVGAFTMEGRFTRKQMDLLEFARVFSAGKNTNFGLGRLDFWVRAKKA